MSIQNPPNLNYTSQVLYAHESHLGLKSCYSRGSGRNRSDFKAWRARKRNTGKGGNGYLFQVMAAHSVEGKHQCRKQGRTKKRGVIFLKYLWKYKYINRAAEGAVIPVLLEAFPM